MTPQKFENLKVANKLIEGVTKTQSEITRHEILGISKTHSSVTLSIKPSSIGSNMMNWKATYPVQSRL